MAGGVGSGGLPTGWEWDYDGSRWFYKYKPNGHIQYHFPSEGDEFPDFVDAASPAPALAPEERLESQQQVRRVTGVAPPPPPSERKKTTKRGMTATARPVGIEWDGDMGGDDGGGVEDCGDGGGGEGVFQPENFMFLGPSTYVDVSPLNEDEDEAAKRSVVGIAQTVGEGSGKVISPAVSTAAGTPAMMKSEPVMESETAGAEHQQKQQQQQQQQTTTHAGVNNVPATTSFEIQGEAVMAPPPVPAQQVPAAVPAPPVEVDAAPQPPPIPQKIPIEEEEEQQQQQRYELAAPDRPFNPVGIIAEMATEDTPRSHIELNPIPVEIDDSSVLAPIETAPPLGIAELSAHQTSPKDAKAPAWGKKTEETKQPSVVHKTGTSTAPPVTLTPMPMPIAIKRRPTAPSKSIPSPVSASSPAASPSPMSAPAATPPITANTLQYKPYAPVSPLHRADTAPVRVPLAKPDAKQHLQPQPQQQEQSSTAPVSPLINPQLTYAPSVLRPANRHSWQQLNTAPEPPQQVPSVGNNDANHPLALNPARYSQIIQPNQVPVNIAGAGNVSPQQKMQAQQYPQQMMPVQGTGSSPVQRRPLPGQQLQAVAQQPAPAQQYPSQVMSGHGAVPPPIQQQQPQLQMMQQGPAQPPMQQHSQSVSMGPGQYPPVPIPQPYGQYQHYPPAPFGHQAPQQWYAPGEQGQAQGYMSPQYQQQPQHQQMQQQHQQALEQHRQVLQQHQQAQQQHQQVQQQQHQVQQKQQQVQQQQGQQQQPPHHQHQQAQQQHQQAQQQHQQVQQQHQQVQQQHQQVQQQHQPQLPAPTNLDAGPPPPSQSIAQTKQPNTVSPAQSQLPLRPQSVMGLIPPSSQPGITPSPDAPSQVQAPRRSSTLDSAGISPLRPRAESQSSNFPMASPSPLEQPRSGSIAASVVSSINSQPSGQQEQSKSIDVKVGTGLDKKGEIPGQGTSSGDSYFPPSKEHPIGLVGRVTEQFASEMGQTSSASGTTARNVTKVEARPLAGTPSPGAGYALGRIEEHEAETASVSVKSVQDSKRDSLASTLQQQPQTRPPTMETQPVRTDAGQQGPFGNTGQPPQGPLPRLDVSAGMAPPQGHNSPAIIPPQSAGSSPGQAMPPGPMRPMPPQGFAPQQQWQGTMQQPTPGMPRPGSVPPQMQMQPNKGKDNNKWTKWFKSSKSTKRPEHPQIGHQQQQPPPPGWGQPWQSGPPMQGQPIQGLPIQQHPFQTPPHMGGPMQPPNMMAPPTHYMPQQGPGLHMQQQHMPHPNQPGQPPRTELPFGAPMQQLQPQPGVQLQIPPQAGQGSPASPTTAMHQHVKSPSLTSVTSLQHNGPQQSPTHSHGPPAMDNAMMPKPLSLRPRSEVFNGNPMPPQGQSNGQMK